MRLRRGERIFEAISEDGLLDFAHGVSWERVDKVDGLGDLVAGEKALGVSEETGGARRNGWRRLGDDDGQADLNNRHIQ